MLEDVGATRLALEPSTATERQLRTRAARTAAEGSQG